jgi:hypothetical protein
MPMIRPKKTRAHTRLYRDLFLKGKFVGWSAEEWQVWVCLKLWEDSMGKSQPGLRAIMEQTKLSRPAVLQSLQSLDETRNAITWIKPRQRGERNLYQMRF